jgi:hypothetical protein
MANFIRLKQIESGSALQASAEVGADFSQSVINIITSEVSAVLPDGVVSSSAQINLISASGYQALATDLEVSIVSSSISTSINILSQTYVTTASLNTISSSLDARVDALESFSSSLDNGFATDAELTLSQSNINIDMGEW